MDSSAGVWRLLLVALIAIAAGAGVGALLGGANSDPFETVLKTVPGERRTVTETQTETVTETTTETVTDSEAIDPPPTGGAAATGDASDDDVDADGCSDSYDTACLAPSDGLNDLNCDEIGERDFGSNAADPFRLDRDGDGLACES